jgi:gamma-D-glutamyl-L-lysine dipeptidyl-peptidase
LSFPPGREPHSVEEIIDAVRTDHVPDPRVAVFDVIAEQRGTAIVLTGQSTNIAAIDDALARLRARGIDVIDEVERLPETTFGDGSHALVRSAVAPLYAAPFLPAPQISQLVLGMRVERLSVEREWLRVRGEDGYIGWINSGYVEEGEKDWAYAWERVTAGDSIVSLGAELLDDEGRTLARLPWGARLFRRDDSYVLADGRTGIIANGQVIDIHDRVRWFPPHGESVASTAQRWIGAPYLWGGVTLNGVDCSGFTQAVMWMHGIALPRDSDLQERIGTPVDPDIATLRPGDLLYFAESGARVTHVAISLGGPHIIHSSLGNGGAHTNDLTGTAPLEKKLRGMLISARRLLPD